MPPRPLLALAALTGCISTASMPGTTPRVREEPVPSAWSGTWTGSGNSTMQTQDGRATHKSTPVEIAIEDHGATLAVTLEPSDTQRCTLEARIEGERAVVTAGQSCRHHETDGEVALTVRDGSVLALRDGQLAIALSLDLEFTDRSPEPRVARLLGSMDATARRTP